MKTKLCALLALGLLAGCQTTSKSNLIGKKVETQSGSVKQECGYDQIQSSEYRVADDYEMKYITNIFSTDPTASYEKNFNNPNFFAPLANEKFKFTSKEIKNKFYYNADGKPNFRLKKDNKIIDGVRYEYQNASDVMVITENCRVYWFERSQYLDITSKGIKNADSSDLTAANYEEIMGPNNFWPFVPPSAEVYFDKFKKTTEIKSSFDSNVMLRTWARENSKPNEIQIYADVKFLDKWGHLERAYTETGETADIVKIQTDVNCETRSVLGACTLTETVGFSFPISFFESNRSGFEIKVEGTRSKIIKVKDYQVSQVLHAISKL